MAGINPIDNNNNNSKHIDTPKIQNQELKESLFTQLDTNKDGKISEEELINGGYSENLSAMQQALFRAERNVNKWFHIDKNYNGSEDNIEKQMWVEHNRNNAHLMDDMSPKDYALKNNLFFEDASFGNLKDWVEKWINDPNPMCGIKSSAKKDFNIELNDEETQLLYDTAKMQMNRWLFKTESLYTRLNNNAYTRLVTADEKESCCGGDITMPPTKPLGVCSTEKDHLFRPLRKWEDINTSQEFKNRVAWGVFKTLSQEQMDNITPKGYETYQKQWNKVSNMKAYEYRDMLKPENEALRKEFELNSNMTVKQIVDYIDIVESVTGQDYDSDNWTVNGRQFIEIVEKVNGNWGDENILQGKTRADIPENRQNLLKYLEENNLLLDQFKQ